MNVIRRRSRVTRRTLRHVVSMCREVGGPTSGRIAPAVYYEPENTGNTFPPANDSGFEGVACVDDAARLLVLLLSISRSELSELGSPTARKIADGLFRFLLYMQTEDGTFHNFILDWNGRPNAKGPTSAPGGLWWSARALRALAWVSGVGLSQSDEAHDPFFRGISSLSLDGQWDQESMLMWAALDYELLHHSSSGLDISTWTTDLVSASSDAVLPDGSNGQSKPHLWGRTQELVLARAAFLNGNQGALEKARRSCHTFLRPLAENCFRERRTTLPYEVTSTYRCLQTVAVLTLDQELADAARRCVAWFWGRNGADRPVIDPRTGRTADGLDGRRLSANSGAESNIEALFCTVKAHRTDLVT
jgi:hypothetical protein